MALQFTSENFEQEVLKSEQVVLVDFYADWCGPCKMMAPVVDEIATEMGDAVKVGKINVDNAQELAQKYSIMTIPTFMVVKNGEPVEKVIGVVPKAQLEEMINKHK